MAIPSGVRTFSFKAHDNSGKAQPSKVGGNPSLVETVKGSKSKAPKDFVKASTEKTPKEVRGTGTDRNPVKVVHKQTTLTKAKVASKKSNAPATKHTGTSAPKSRKR